MQLVGENKYMMNRWLVREYLRTDRKLRNSAARAFYQHEHNLVLKGGRSVPGDTPLGNIPSLYDENEKYMVRVSNKNEYMVADIIYEYNIPNIMNITSSGIFPESVCEKIVYAPSLPFSYSNHGVREIDVMTNFVHMGQPRRRPITSALSEKFATYKNVEGIYSLAHLSDCYSNAKIIVNFRQSSHHHSIEEFRILPALTRGCIVISEDVPLRHHLPYHEHVLWCSYDQLLPMTEHVFNNYDKYFSEIHLNSKIPELISSMRADFFQPWRSNQHVF